MVQREPLQQPGPKVLMAPKELMGRPLRKEPRVPTARKDQTGRLVPRAHWVQMVLD